jgi:putative transposase
MKYKSKKQNTQSITIPKSAIKFKDQKAYIYPTILKDSIKIGRRTLKKHKKKFKKFKNLDFNIEHDCKLCFNGFEYYLLIPIDKKVQTKKDENKILAFDPGEKTFQTAFSENEIIESNINQKKYDKIKNKIKLLQSLSAKKEIKLNKKKNLKLHQKIKNLVNDMHWKLITYVKKNYNDILIPNFESQKIVKKMSFGLKKVKQNLLSFCHYKFRMRLIEKTKELHNFRVYTVREDYTSKTCTNCGSIKDIKNERIYNCEKCNLTIGRDINAARNIFLRYCSLL